MCHPTIHNAVLSLVFTMVQSIEHKERLLGVIDLTSEVSIKEEADGEDLFTDLSIQIRDFG